MTVDISAQETQRNTNLNRVSMFGNSIAKRRRQEAGNSGVKQGSGMLSLHQKQTPEMKPMNIKRPKMESPDHDFRKRMSDVSLPPSFRMHLE